MLKVGLNTVVMDYKKLNCYNRIGRLIMCISATSAIVVVIDLRMFVDDFWIMYKSFFKFIAYAVRAVLFVASG